MDAALKEILDQIQSILAEAESVSNRNKEIRIAKRTGHPSELVNAEIPGAEFLHHQVRLSEVIRRFAPANSSYRMAAQRFDNSIGGQEMDNLIEVLKALKTDYEAGYLKTFTEIIHADVFADFLESADHLRGEGYKDAAAVIAGGVLEDQLRKLSTKNSLSITAATKPKMLGELNDGLYKAAVYNKIQMQTILGWIQIRNSAAHGKYAEYNDQQVSQMIAGVREFIGRHPA